MYRLPEVAAAMGLAQLEKIDWFVGLRQQMAKMYTDVIKETSCNWLIPQNVPLGDVNSYYTYAMRFQNKDVSWEEFRIEYIANGGDGIYAAWTLCYLEDSVNDIQARLAKMGLNERFNTALGQCSVAEKVQSQLMQLTTNQKYEQEMKTQAEALRKTITFFQ